MNNVKNNMNNNKFQNEEIQGAGETSEINIKSNQLLAKMPEVERFASHYNMNHNERGLALIFNHENFDPATNLNKRLGTDLDCERLVSTLISLNFDVQPYKDLRLSELLSTVEKVSQMDHSNSDCLMIVIMSHGERNSIIHARDSEYKLDTIMSYFTPNRCPTLAGKPKLVIIQACQGDQTDSGVTLKRDSNSETDSDAESLYFKIPTYKDFLIAYSTIPGYFSWRNTSKGSWFIQALCMEIAEEVNKHQQHRLNILSLLTFVSQRVAYDYESNSSQYKDQQKQIPCITSMLTRLLVFNDKSNKNDME